MYYVYIMTNKTNTVLYTGVTNNLERRLQEHKSGLIAGFTKKYQVKKLVYLEESPNIKDAIVREKLFKNWHRGWKSSLIKAVNPTFKDLSLDTASVKNPVTQDADPETSSG